MRTHIRYETKWIWSAAGKDSFGRYALQIQRNFNVGRASTLHVGKVHHDIQDRICFLC